jgi:radical SAM protein with 4Fe4S-binding SPASM domain
MLFNKPKYNCKAAEFSLLFQPSGEVLACHYNRGYILGNYPADSINSIWKSEKRKKLIKSIQKAKFEFGCSGCLDAINSGNLNLAGLNKYDYVENSSNKFPSSMEFQLDNICNLECIMCSGEYSSQIRKNREKGKPYISPYDHKFITQIEAYIPYLKQVSFTGGEPFLFDIYYEIWDRIKYFNPRLPIYISTNGTVLNDKVKKYLEVLNFNFAISIDSLKKENYEVIRKNASLTVTLSNIDYFIKYCKSNNRTINIKSLITPFNYLDIPNLIEYFNNLEINVIPKTVILPSFASMESLNKSELINVIDVLKKTNFQKESATQMKNLERLNEITRHINSILLKKENLLKNSLAVSDIVKLKETLFNHIFELKQNKYQVTDIERKNFESLFDTKLSEKELANAINNFLNVPSETLRAEFYRCDFEKFKARFIQSAENNFIF